MTSQQEQHHKALEKWANADKRCPTCSKLLLYEKRRNTYCSSSCAAKVTNTRRPSRLQGVCSKCKGKVRADRRYCGPCWEGNNPRNQNLEEARTDRTRRLILIREGGHVCSRCEGTTWQGVPIPLELDHRDGDHRNNSRTNLRILCPNCHALTDTYKGRNRGNGRPFR